MDNFVEQITSKKPDARDTLLRIVIMLVGSLLSAFSIMLIFDFGAMVLLVTVGVFYLMWYLLSISMIEYEYIITNNELDIDKIMGRRKRKRLITVKLNTTEAWGEYDGSQGDGANATVAAHNGHSNYWYILANHEKHGKVMVLFSPNERVTFAVNKSVPYSLRRRDLTEKEKQIEEAEAETENISNEDLDEIKDEI